MPRSFAGGGGASPPQGLQASGSVVTSSTSYQQVIAPGAITFDVTGVIITNASPGVARFSFDGTGDHGIVVPGFPVELPDLRVTGLWARSINGQEIEVVAVAYA